MSSADPSLPSLLREFLGRGVGTTHQTETSQSDMSAGQTNDRKDARFFDAIDLEEARQLSAMVQALRPEHSVEIGFCSGVSALCILHALERNGHGLHHVIDPFQSSYAKGAGLENVREAGLEARLDFHETFPESVLPGLPRLQFAFVDASHLFDLSMLDFMLIDKRLDVGGVVGFHDLWMPALRDLVRYVLRNRAYRLRDAQPGPPATLGARLRRWRAALLSLWPGAEHCFRAELLQPWESLGLGNLVFLEKTGEDQRDWRHHVPF